MGFVITIMLVLNAIFIGANPDSSKAHNELTDYHLTFHQDKASFRYIIFSNKVDDTGRPKDSSRRVKVLIEASSFSEPTLKSIFRLLSRRFPTPDWLEVQVYTSLKQIPTPEEEDAGGISESHDDPEFDKHHRAILFRLQGNEFFRYTIDPPDRTLKTVVLKGKDPFNPR